MARPGWFIGSVVLLWLTGGGLSTSCACSNALDCLPTHAISAPQLMQVNNARAMAGSAAAQLVFSGDEHGRVKVRRGCWVAVSGCSAVDELAVGEGSCALAAVKLMLCLNPLHLLCPAPLFAGLEVEGDWPWRLPHCIVG